MRIFFIGTVEFSSRALLKLIDLGADVVGVATMQNSNFNSDFFDLSSLTQSHNIPTRYVDNINNTEISLWIKGLQVDVIFCFGWSKLLKKDILCSAPMGVIGYHPSALPRNRGRHPLIWALVLGLKQTGSTFFFMNDGADSGDILSQRLIDIDDIDDANTLYGKMIEVALMQIEDFYPKLVNQTYQRTPQNHTLASVWRKRGKLDGQIDFRMTSKAICNLVRALAKPYIGAHLVFNGKEVKVWKVAASDFSNNNIEPGKVLLNDGSAILVKTADAAIEIIGHEFIVLPKMGEYL